ncbi:MAG: rhodanese-like domain-containing protein [Thermomonas sp.]|uniref:rhodanese-like domain-containing protein n=1 Tax=Thermomonas sp. TaxID=1971895 RepID=UPI001EBA2DFB|nr:rhodanese-like domain-containing protein [Thermomonas sp.]MBV2208478.1 rhodanese-like domain-containing protein [Thermomonas sp.]
MTIAELTDFLSRHLLLSLALVGITLALIGNEIAGLLSGIRRIGPAQLVALINRDDALVVDLRAINDFDKGHIAGAKNVQMSQFDPESKNLAPAKALPVVLVCNVGQTATTAAKRLRKAGFANVSVLEGGIRAWQMADLPLVKGR